MSQLELLPKHLLILLLMICLILGSCQFRTESLEMLASGDEANPILFVHAWGGNNAVFIHMINFFEQDNWSENYLHAYDFEDYNNCSAEANLDNAGIIGQWVDEILLETGREKVNLIGYSMGGLSSRYYIKYLGGNQTVDNYVSIVSPHHGATDHQCGANGVNEFVLTLNQGDETPYGILTDTIGFRQDPYFVGRSYTGEHIPGSINYTSIYHNFYDLSFDGTYTSLLDGAYNVLYDGETGRNHIGILSQERTYELIQSAIGGPFDLPPIEDRTPSEPFPIEEIALVAGALGALTIVARSKYYKNKIRTARMRRQIKKTQSILGTFTDHFSKDQLLYLAALARPSSSKPDTVDERQIPHELKEYRYLMHPVRLSIMKLLYKNYNLTSTDIKHQLNISWGEYSSHISSLVKHGFISTKDGFHNGIKVNIVLLEEMGRKEYESLFELLKEFLEDDGPDYYKQQIELDDLYPKEEGKDKIN